MPPASSSSRNSWVDLDSPEIQRLIEWYKLKPDERRHLAKPCGRAAPEAAERPSKLPRIVARASGEVNRQQQREEGDGSRPKQARMEDKRRREAMRKLLNSIEAACREYSRAMVHCQYRGQALRDETRKRDVLPGKIPSQFHLVPPSVRTGPLSLLRESVGESSNEMVKVLLVWEEENNDENGGAELEEVMGYLVLFDKTFNLLLKEVSARPRFSDRVSWRAPFLFVRGVNVVWVRRGGKES
ncbi:hypothetical protein FOZ61_006074 [Perkinsus olseni]|uniref:Uncharacterized protein n=1 Tax=Perkinsus olseni TaxID=32597 RepID=A0A7J6LET2_PEROL|nr:hypothetical protein FOZ61_006074 [Perkinsus olseni]